MKSLLDEGFQVTGFDQRQGPGGIWRFTEDPHITSVTSATRTQLSKFLVGDVSRCWALDANELIANSRRPSPTSRTLLEHPGIQVRQNSVTTTRYTLTTLV